MKEPERKKIEDLFLQEYLALPLDQDGTVLPEYRERAAQLRKLLLQKYPSGDVMEHLYRGQHLIYTCGL